MKNLSLRQLDSAKPGAGSHVILGKPDVHVADSDMISLAKAAIEGQRDGFVEKVLVWRLLSPREHLRTFLTVCYPCLFWHRQPGVGQV